MAAPPEAADVLKPLQGHSLLAAEIPFEREGFGGGPQLLDVAVLEVLDAHIWIDPRFREDLLGTGQPDAIDVGESDLDPLVAREIDAGNPSHEGNDQVGK
jgi:hypothetical protein